MKYVHTNIVSRDWKKLAEFYINVFECKKTSETNLSGDWLEKGTAVKNAKLKGMHLILPGYEDNGPTLEIFEYEAPENNAQPVANRVGYAHIAFSVENVDRVLMKIIENGGKELGEVVSKEYKSGRLTFTYASDPEGNIIEIQNWQPKK